MTLTLTRLAQKAKEEPQLAFDSIVHLVDLELLRSSHKRLSRDASAGVDKMERADYEKDLETRLTDLLERLKTKKYRAQPVKRAYIPKEDGRYRPIGIAAHEDKIVQRAVVTVMEAIYEQDFMPCSYGFRPGNNAHQVLPIRVDDVERNRLADGHHESGSIGIHVAMDIIKADLRRSMWRWASLIERIASKPAVKEGAGLSGGREKPGRCRSDRPGPREA